jgi:RNA polymerase sigma-70 factor (ECF subfamily)
MQQLEMDDRDNARVGTLYAQHAAALWRYAMRLTGDHARAEDVVQETLLRAWQHPEVTDDGERPARAWLFTVARNIIIDERRSARFRNEFGTPDPERTHDRAGPDEVDSALDRMLLSGALAQLTPAHRVVIRRSYYQGWTTAQIAADLDIAEGTVKSRLHYAVRALRLILQEMGYSGTPAAVAAQGFSRPDPPAACTETIGDVQIPIADDATKSPRHPDELRVVLNTVDRPQPAPLR